MKSILDRSFRYVPSHATDIRKTFERIQRERAAAHHKAAETVVPMSREKRSA
jgi:hypothetical protein